MGQKKAADRAADLFASRLRKGGQKIRLSGRADLYERDGRHLLQVNDVGSQVKVRGILSNRIRIKDELRNIGNMYGACVEEIRIGLSGDFLPEVVDGGKGASGGITPHLVAIRETVRIAEVALGEMPIIRHRVTGKGHSGAHHPIQTRALVDAVCVAGSDLTEIAIVSGWFVKREGRTIVPKQQSQKLKSALVDGLEAIKSAWSDANVDVARFPINLEVG